MLSACDQLGSYSKVLTISNRLQSQLQRSAPLASLLEEIRIERIEQLLLVRLTASHFLWHMARIITGVLVQIGMGRLDEQTLVEYLEQFSPKPLSFIAPASGLYLERVYYRGESRVGELVPTIHLR
jgi:tRNA pseudouridine38-40 synthase